MKKGLVPRDHGSDEWCDELAHGAEVVGDSIQVCLASFSHRVIQGDNNIGFVDGHREEVYGGAVWIDLSKPAMACLVDRAFEPPKRDDEDAGPKGEPSGTP